MKMKRYCEADASYQTHYVEKILIKFNHLYIKEAIALHESSIKILKFVGKVFNNLHTLMH